MSQIGRLWAGKVFGTNTGNLFAEFTASDSAITGQLLFMDDRFGPVVYEVTGTFDGTELKLSGNPTQSGEGVEVAPITASATLTSDGQLRGQWSSTLGTGGTFILFPHDAPQQKQAGPSALPEQLYTASRTLGALRLYSDDVLQLIGFLKRDFTQNRVVVTYRERGNEISKYEGDFESSMGRLGELRYLKLFIQEPEAYGLNRLAIVELNADGSNEVHVQGIQESWVVGKAEAVASELRVHQKTLSTTFRKFGLNINGLLALAALAALPELTFGRRIIFLVLLVFIAWLVVQAHARFIPNVLIYLSPRTPSRLERAWPQILSWIIAVTSGLVALIAYGLLTGDFPWTPEWLSPTRP